MNENVLGQLQGVVEHEMEVFNNKVTTYLGIKIEERRKKEKVLCGTCVPELKSDGGIFQIDCFGKKVYADGGLICVVKGVIHVSCDDGRLPHGLVSQEDQLVASKRVNGHVGCETSQQKGTSQWFGLSFSLDYASSLETQ